ncbi:expressed unknown protein [Seminavis robusta]|uniref:Uncharacterized protein n=1 Tax=Seminavis robusta TaxID=568900 RepID=A0A9N8HBW4_9STRA|nr:expressed unknown protein [Seminavis robusta]|eukprot:Sro275_g105670.1 n/a (114) ;mRNA; r:20825-21166
MLPSTSAVTFIHTGTPESSRSLNVPTASLSELITRGAMVRNADAANARDGPASRANLGHPLIPPRPILNTGVAIAPAPADGRPTDGLHRTLQATILAALDIILDEEEDDDMFL